MNYEQEADKLLEVFGPYMAIEHCKRVIEVLEKLRPTLAVISFSYIEQLNTHRLILSELEDRVK